MYRLLCDQLAHTESPTSEAWEMLRHATPWTPKDLIARPHVTISPEAVVCLNQWLNLRQQGQPLAYILGKKHFWRFDLMVSESVLIPRSDTECLIEWLLTQFSDDSKKTVLDLGAGSGAIGIAIALEKPHWQVVATDLSEQALEVTKANALALGANNLTTYQGDWFSALSKSVLRTFDIIISNPPYLAGDDLHLQQGDLLFEPETALIAAQQGLEALLRIIHEAPVFMQEGGLLILEHGYQQQAQLLACLQAARYQKIIGHRDYQGNPRFITAIKPT